MINPVTYSNLTSAAICSTRDTANTCYHFVQHFFNFDNSNVFSKHLTMWHFKKTKWPRNQWADTMRSANRCGFLNLGRSRCSLAAHILHHDYSHRLALILTQCLYVEYFGIVATSMQRTSKDKWCITPQQSCTKYRPKQSNFLDLEAWNGSGFPASNAFVKILVCRDFS